MISKLMKNNTVFVPKEVREALDISVGDDLRFDIFNEEVRLTKAVSSKVILKSLNEYAKFLSALSGCSIALVHWVSVYSMTDCYRNIVCSSEVLIKYDVKSYLLSCNVEGIGILDKPMQLSHVFEGDHLVLGVLPVYVAGVKSDVYICFVSSSPNFDLLYKNCDVIKDLVRKVVNSYE